jgi:hypothetical protein
MSACLEEQQGNRWCHDRPYSLGYLFQKSIAENDVPQRGGPIGCTVGEG